MHLPPLSLIESTSMTAYIPARVRTIWVYLIVKVFNKFCLILIKFLVRIITAKMTDVKAY